MDHFEYTSLSDPALLFRVLTLEPAQASQDIKCQLNVHALRRPPSFEALSYVWGPPDFAETITCQGKALRVTGTLKAALRVLRYSTKRRVLWIDQICIDQNNKAEKSEQVQNMAQIYSSAHRVVMWLGENNLQEACAAMDLVENLASLRMEALQESSHFPADDELEDLDLPLSASSSWIALQKMLSLKYFTRIWIIQEVALAQDAVMIWGQSKIAWITFKKGWLIAHRLGMYLPDRSVGSTDLSLPVFHHKVLFEPRYTWRDLLVFTTTWFEATNPEDRVNALVGLVNDATPLQVDYDLSVEETYMRATRHVIKLSGNLDILGFTLNPEFNSSALPLWASAWACGSNGRRVSSLSSNGYNASDGTTAQMKRPVDGTSLNLRGILFDSVVHTAPRIESLDSGWNDELQATLNFCSSNANSLQKVGRTNFLRLFLSTITAGSGWLNDGSGTIFGANQENLLSDFLAYIANTSMAHIWSSDQDETQLRCQKHLMELVELAVQSEPSLELNRRIDDRSWVRERMDDEHVSNSVVAQGATLSLNLCLDFFEREAEYRFDLALVRAMGGRKLFMTTQDRLGIGPESLQTYDILCVLFGGSCIYALRPIPGTEDYAFLGECYVYGVMNGEIMGSYNQGLNQSHDFCLR